MIKRILVGLAGTHYTPVAIRTAVELARQRQAELTGVTVVDPARLSNVGSVPLGAEEAAEELREHRLRLTAQRVEEVIAQFESACAAAGVVYRVAREKGDAFRKMLAYSRYHDVTVFGLRSVFEYWFEEDDSCSLLARLVEGGVRPILAVSEQYRPVRRVLIAYSGSVESANTFRQFIQLGPWPELTLRLVTFGEPEEGGEKLLADAAGYFRTRGLEPETDHVPGSAMDQLLPYAEATGADMIVLGNSARRYLLKRLFGETALHVMQHADRPLFLHQ
jgi:nucleotide-binding universal stress UspA family protein